MKPHWTYMSTASMITPPRRSKSLHRIFLEEAQSVSFFSYCKRVYQAEPDPKGVFLILLRIYLRPSSVGGQATSLAQALDLISRHSPRLDSAEALQLLPPLVNASDVRNFLHEALKTPKVDTRIARELWKAREHQIDRKLMLLQSRRVKITDTRMLVPSLRPILRLCHLITCSRCPQCLKRLGNSVIAVHPPRLVESILNTCDVLPYFSRGEVTHYQCREAFVKRNGS